MADGIAATPGSGVTLAADDIGGTHFPRTKITVGADGTNDGDVSSANPLPVSLASVPSHAVTNAGTFAVQATGTVTANAGTNLNTSALAVEAGGNLEAIGDAVGVDGAASLPANAVVVGGHDGSMVRQLKMTAAGYARVDVATALPAGTNAIGKLAANSGVDIGDVDVTTQPARAATTDTITAKLATDKIHDGTTALTPKFAAIDAASSGDNTIVAAVTSKKIRVLSVFLVAAAAVTVRFESGASGTALTGQMQLAANGGFVLPFSPVGHFESASGVLLNLELSGAISVDGSICYIEV